MRRYCAELPLSFRRGPLGCLNDCLFDLKLLLIAVNLLELRLIPKTFQPFLINNLENKFNLLILKFFNSFKKIIDSKELKLITTLKLMEANSFQKTLEKGFAIVLDTENNIIKKYDDAKGYKEGKVQFIDGIRKITLKN